jgi:hypothetical protein
MDFTTTAQAMASFESQGKLLPGTGGWWRVYGATPKDIRKGDLVLSQGNYADLILDTFEAKAAPLRFGFVSDDGRFTIGALASVIVLRLGTRNTLA